MTQVLHILIDWQLQKHFKTKSDFIWQGTLMTITMISYLTPISLDKKKIGLLFPKICLITAYNARGTLHVQLQAYRSK